MTHKLPAYPEYQPSGVDWLGDIPAHWDMVPLFGEYAEQQVKNTGLVENTVLSLSYGQIVVKSPEKLHGLVPESFETYQIVDPGDIIIRPTDLQNDHTSLRIGFSRHSGIITSAYMCLRTWNDLSPEYGYQVLNVFDLTKAIYAYGSGLRQNLSFDDLKRVRVPVPPPDEQDAIVRFLNAAETRIRRYIRAKQKLIKLLNEQKQAIIQQAVTRGLNPDAPMKDSDVAWLGEIPAHWNYTPLREITYREKNSIVNGPFGSDLLTTELKAEGIPVVYIRDISSGVYKRVSKSHITHTKATQLSFCNVTSKDVLVAKVGDPPGTSAVYPESEIDGIVTQDVIRIRPDFNKVNPAYLSMLLNSKYGRDTLSRITVVSTRGRFSLADFKRLAFFLPSLNEQEEILEGLNQNLFFLNQTSQMLQNQIELVREYRTRLIADVVTGKVDVRGLAFEMPEEFDEGDLLDVDEDEVFEEDDLEEVFDAED